MDQPKLDFVANAADAMANEQLQANLRKFTGILKMVYQLGVDSVENFDELVRYASEVKKHTIDHLDVYLEQFESRVTESGGKVYYAQTGEDLNRIVLDICRSAKARAIVKGKSMVSEETGLNKSLLDAGLEVVETDMGEYIIQIANERPSHIMGPALHKNRYEIAELFYKHHDLGPRSLEEIPDIVAEARQVLREKFLQADVGITGANALIAETGGVLLVTNEGNGDLCSSLPKVHIVVSGIEKLVPAMEDVGAILRVLARSLIGQSMSSYTSIFTGPRETPHDDGPDEFHVVLLDNHRTEMLGNEYRDMLRCIRCSACMNQCPVFGETGGHAYGSVYVGPMGSVLTPIMEGMEAAADLPNACCSDGRCEEVCPMMIPLPDLLRKLRAHERDLGLSKRSLRWGLSAYMTLARFPRLYQVLARVGVSALSFAERRGKRPLSFTGKSGWTQVRDMPVPQGQTFQSLLAQRRKRNRGAPKGS